ncbi:predicted protein [Chaetomium globosum CBS 148.51]|uniref:Uncharacterized protein n=1 Tax=Chaetomium globosum (strain ATCC 6205 / CBS 148.51 / DSM 1962 / NBRC 6347 / NRRL 1970) TaxID=306901 RepID=Q2H1A5_CHAGB|nr:uncharacterized protein CHGG_04441 [Chaetomium globosum CBS 148.51]EAQ87822.1 predicted protein [Chaetomium globosum CBS 148.51]
MPAIASSLGIRGPDPQHDASKDNVAPSTTNTVVWIVAAAVGGLIVVGGIVALILIRYTKRRQIRRDQELHPYLTREEIIKRQKMEDSDPFLELESHRKHMINKSLATRSSYSAGSGFSAMANQIDRELAEMERQETTKLKDDWKKWEAKVRKERSESGGGHPATSVASEPPVLTIPMLTKHRSPSRTPSAEGQTISLSAGPRPAGVEGTMRRTTTIECSSDSERSRGVLGQRALNVYGVSAMVGRESEVFGNRR